MKITCDKCNALYDVDDCRIPAEGLTMKCPRCQASFVVRRAAAPAPAAPAPAGAPAAGNRYYLRRRTGKVFGPFLERAIASMLEQRKLDGDEDVSADGQTWRPLVQVPALASFVRGQASAAPAGDFAGGAGFSDLPAPKGGLDSLADLPAPRGGFDLADLPAPRGDGLDGLTDLPAPRGGVELADLPAPRGMPGPPRPPPPPFAQGPAGGDLGEFDLGSPEPAGRADGHADLPAPKRAAWSMVRSSSALTPTETWATCRRPRTGSRTCPRPRVRTPTCPLPRTRCPTCRRPGLPSFRPPSGAPPRRGTSPICSSPSPAGRSMPSPASG